MSLQKSFLALFFASSSAAQNPAWSPVSAARALSPLGRPGSNEQAALLPLNSRPLKLQPTSCTPLRHVECQTQCVRPCRTEVKTAFSGAPPSQVVQHDRSRVCHRAVFWPQRRVLSRFSFSISTVMPASTQEHGTPTNLASRRTSES